MSFRKIYGYTYSENGWRMCNRDECVVANPVPNSNTAPVRKGDAATILNAWLIWYHRNVEKITTSVWGWSATNDVGNSNHLSGTALDINAPKYPWGYYRMPAATIAKVERGLSLFEGTIFWGRRWSKPDEMHYQLGFPEGDRRNAAFAKKLSNGHLGIYGPELESGLTDKEWKEIFSNLGYVADQFGPRLDVWGPESSLGVNAARQELTVRDALARFMREGGQNGR